jgi:hypothetical protein
MIQRSPTLRSSALWALTTFVQHLEALFASGVSAGSAVGRIHDEPGGRLPTTSAAVPQKSL